MTKVKSINQILDVIICQLDNICCDGDSAREIKSVIKDIETEKNNYISAHEAFLEELKKYAINQRRLHYKMSNDSRLVCIELKNIINNIEDFQAEQKQVNND